MFDLIDSTQDLDKKNSKKVGADGLFKSAAKWAEMAANHKNGRNPKKNFSSDQGHYVAS